MLPVQVYASIYIESNHLSCYDWHGASAILLFYRSTISYDSNEFNGISPAIVFALSN